MAQETGPSSQVVVDIPGVGQRSFPASMPLEEIQRNAQILMRQAQPQDQAFDAPALNRGPWEARARGFVEGAKQGTKRVLTPEVTGGLAALAAPETGGASFLIPPAVAAGTSLVRDALSGEDKSTMALDALGHGTLNAIPGITRLPMGEGGATVGSKIANMIPGKAGLVAKITSMFGGAPAAAAPAAADVGQYATSQAARDLLVRKSVELENAINSGTLKGDALLLARRQMAAIDGLIKQATTQARAPMPTAQALQGTGLPAIQTAGQTMKDRIAMALRAALAGGSVAKEENR